MIPSIILLLTAFGWSFMLPRHGRDARWWLLALLLGVIATRRTLSMCERVERDGWTVSVAQLTPGEWVTFVISIVALVTVWQFDRTLVKKTAGDQKLRLLAGALEASRDAVMITDDMLDQPGPRILFVNKAACELTGYTREELLARTKYSLHGPKTSRNELERMKSELRSGQACVGEVVNYGKDGSEFWVQWAVSPVHDTEGRVAHYLWLLRDVTQAKHAVEVVDRVEGLYENLIKGVNIVAWEVDIPTMQYTFVSDVAERMMGYPVSEWYEEGFWERHIHPEDRAEAEGLRRTKVEAGEDYDCTYRIMAADGRVLWIRDIVTVVKRNGQPRMLRGVIVDVTERRQIEHELAQSEARYRALIEVTATGYSVVDAKGCVLEANAEFLRLTGRKMMTDIMGKSVTDWTAPYDIERNADEIRKGTELGYTRGLEMDYIHPDGSILPIEINAMLLREKDSERLIALCRDISTRKRDERAVRASEARYRTLYEGNPLMIFTLDRSGIVLDANAAAAEQLETTRDEIVGKSILTGYQPHLHDKVNEQLKACFADPVKKHSWQLEKRTRRGRRIHVSESARVIEQPGGGQALLLVCEDITEQRESELKLRASEQRLASMFQHTPLAVILWSKDFTVAEWNPAAEKIFGYSAAEAVGSHASLVVPGHEREYVDKLWNQLIQNRGGSRGSNENITKDGRIISCEWYNSTLLDEKGKVRGVVSIVEDVTERRRGEKRQQLLMLELDHRVKNNLASILALAEQSLHRSTSLEQFGESFIGRVRAMSRMHELLAHAGWRAVDIREIVTRSLEAFMMGDHAPISIEGGPAMLPSRVSSALNIALHELATNATKYGSLSVPSGHVNVRWQTSLCDDGRTRLLLEWQESGGPVVNPPLNRGFGTGLIEGVIAYEHGGHVNFQFAPSGLRAEIDVSFSDSDTPVTPVSVS